MNDLTNQNGDLLCAHCGGFYLHRTVTSHYLRDQEDSNMGTLVVTTHKDSHIQRNVVVPDENPSQRRSGIAIEFFCEDCCGRSELTIAQHKGATVVAMRKSQRWPESD